ncbi:MAG: beta-lactamase family protein, partial [Deltaproteobacteria bacterium]|nr:beta-lactamase family protein [Deltaproteobacteria bacterium]
MSCGEEAQSRDLYICPLIGRRERGSTPLTRPHSTGASVYGPRAPMSATRFAERVPKYGDSPIALRDFMVGYFTPGGACYDATKNFTASPPGTHYLYSNLATALLGYLVEAATGTRLDDHCDARIFAPLSMADTGWHLADFAPRDVAMPYESVGGELYEWGLFGYPDYPDGQLRSSADDLARFLAAWAGAGTYDGAQILEAATVAEALSVQFPDIDPTQGLSWYYDTVGARTVV